MKVEFKFEDSEVLVVLGSEQEQCLTIKEGHTPCTKEYIKSLKPVKNVRAVQRCLLLLTQYGYELETLTL